MSGLRGIVGAISLLLGALLVTAASPAAAAAQDEVFVEVNPSTIQTGYQVGILASCGDDLNSASVTSDAFGEITLTPHQGSLLQGAATIPTGTHAGEHQVKLSCPNGNTADAVLYVLDMAQPTRGPKAGGGGTAAGETGTGSAGPLLLAGAGVVALAAGAGLLLAHRRRPS